jgi:uroporphyrinogen decarboxylase
MGTWPQTIRRWVEQGFPRDLAEAIGEDNDAASYYEWIGVDLEEGAPYFRPGARVPMKMGQSPAHAVEVRSEDERTETYQDERGILLRRYKTGGADSSIPQFLEFPVKSRADWASMKRRLRVEDPGRVVSPEEIAPLREAAAAGRLVTCHLDGFYAQLRWWAGTEGLSYLLHDDPALCREMVDLGVELALHALRQLPADLPVHRVHWWEDMAFKGGPLLSPRSFEALIVPGYTAVMEELHRHGCPLASVDCDGNPGLLVPGWLRAGLNVLLPCEQVGGTDLYGLRERHGRELRLEGGVCKQEVAQGPEAIDRELARLAPLLAQGGFIPHLDHNVPPDLSLENFLYYRQQKCRLLGKPWSPPPGY